MGQSLKESRREKGKKMMEECKQAADREGEKDGEGKEERDEGKGGRMTGKNLLNICILISSMF